MTPSRIAMALVIAASTCLAAPSQLTTHAASKTAASLARHMPKLRSADAAERQAAYDAFLHQGDEGRTALRNALLPLRKQRLAECQAFTLSQSAQARLLKAGTMMAKARAEALRVIFDKKIYPDANHGRAGQPIVDKAVAAVKALFPAYRKLMVPHAKRFARVLHAYRRIQEIDKQLALCNTPDLKLDPPLASLLPNIKAELVELLTAEVAFRRYSVQCLRYNQRIRTSTSAAERKVIDLTNEYRMQLGIRPLAINERLVRAARKHSAEMTALHYFGHHSPKPENRTPTLRCRKQGYKHFRGENCAYGTGAAGAFRGWYNSSGHHRNMVNPKANEIGVGHAGPWTEDFGTNPALDLDHLPRRRDGKANAASAKPERKPRTKGNPWEALLPPKPPAQR